MYTIYVFIDFLNQTSPTSEHTLGNYLVFHDLIQIADGIFFFRIGPEFFYADWDIIL